MQFSGRLFSLLAGVLFLLGACSSQNVDPQSYKISSEDHEKAKLAPTPLELVIQKRLLLPLIVSKGDGVTDMKQFIFLREIHEQFRKHGLFSVITQEQIENLRKLEAYRDFNLDNVANIIQMAKRVNAHFVSQMRFLGETVNLVVFTADSGKMVFKESIHFDSENPKKSVLKLRELVQTFFPLRGFILETRGNKTVVKISVGSSLGVQMDREFLIREKINVITLTKGVETIAPSFTPLALAKARVIKVNENESWLYIEPGDREKIKIGQVAFSEPEEVSFFD